MHVFLGGKMLLKKPTQTMKLKREGGQAQGHSTRSNTGLSNPDVTIFPLYLFPKVKSQGH